jgi:bacterioferritin (cytochrome b1)
MKSLEATAALNQLLQILCRSLPMYLADAKPWVQPGHQALQAMLDRLVADQRRYAKRLAEAVTALGGRPDPGRFFAEFAAKNDLSLDFLLQELIAAQEEDLVKIDRCVLQLSGEPCLHSLAEEIRGNIRGHLEILQEAAHAKS